MTCGDTLAIDEASKTAGRREPLGSLFRDLRTSASGCPAARLQPHNHSLAGGADGRILMVTTATVGRGEDVGEPSG
jgi:hypothetical protein